MGIWKCGINPEIGAPDNVESVQRLTGLTMWNRSTLGQSWKRGMSPELDESKNIESFYTWTILETWNHSIVGGIEECEHSWTGWTMWNQSTNGKTMYFSHHYMCNHTKQSYATLTPYHASRIIITLTSKENTMFTPDWNDAPEWANYVAMDEDGEWYWYENEPTILFSRYTTDGRCEFIETPKVWKSTLQSRPKI